MHQIKWLSCLLALQTENAFVSINNLEHVLAHIKYFRRAWFLYRLFLLQTDLYRVIDSHFWLGMESRKCAWRPFRMHFSDAFLYIKSNVYLLVFGKLHYWNALLFILINIGKIFCWFYRSFLFKLVIHAVINWLNVKCGNFSYLIVQVLHVQDKILFANPTIVDILWCTFTFPWIFKIIDFITDKWKQPDSLAKPLIVKYRRVLYYAD